LRRPGAFAAPLAAIAGGPAEARACARRMRVALPPAASLARFANERAGAGACCAEDAEAPGVGGAPHVRGSLDAAAPGEQGDGERAAGACAAPEPARPAGARGAGLLRSLSAREPSPATPSAAVRARAALTPLCKQCAARQCAHGEPCAGPPCHP
jgi:hypothetical protein